MATVDNVNLCGRNIATIGFRFGGIEGGFVLAPDDQQARLLFAHPGLPLGIVLDVGAVVVKKIALNFYLAGAIEKVEFIGPEIRIVTFNIGIVDDVAGARGFERQEIDSQGGLFGGAIGPEGAAGFPVGTEPGVVRNGI